HSAIVDALLLALIDVDDDFARDEAVQALAKVSQGESRVIDALLIALTNGSEYFVDTVVCTLRDLYKKTGDSYVSELSLALSELTTLADPNTDVPQVTAMALGKLSNNPPRTTDLLLSSFSNVPRAKKIAIKILGHLGKGSPHVLDTLLSIA